MTVTFDKTGPMPVPDFFDLVSKLLLLMYYSLFKDFME